MTMSTGNEIARSDQLRLLACQIDVPSTTSVSDRDRHLDELSCKISRELTKTPADLVLLPELASIDYSRESFNRLDLLAETLDGPSFQIWSAVARDHKTHVAYSFPRQAEDGYRITLAVVDPFGQLVGHYDKIHLAQYGASMEKDYFSRGDGLLIFDINGFRLAPIICYDIRIPELCRTLVVDHKADVILHPSAYFRDESFYSWHTFAMSRAIENQVYFLSLNRAGKSYGKSIFCMPWVDEAREPVIFPENEEQLVQLILRKSEIATARQDYSFLKDRLDDYRLSLTQHESLRKGRPHHLPRK